MPLKTTTTSDFDGEPDRLFFLSPRWPVFYIDNHLLVVYKPAGLLVQGDQTGDPCLLDLGKQWLKTRFDKPGNVFLGMVHRLDRPVAGVVVFARTSKAAARLSQQIRDRSVEKHYLAVVNGSMPDRSGRLVDHIEHSGRQSRVIEKESPHSQKAALSYRVLGEQEGKSLLSIKLETGRKHQIRLQLSHRGCAILGDVRYGAGAPLPGRMIALLARDFALEHPTQNKRMVFSCPSPLGWPWPDDKSEFEIRPPWDWRDFL